MSNVISSFPHGTSQCNVPLLRFFFLKFFLFIEKYPFFVSVIFVDNYTVTNIFLSVLYCCTVHQKYLDIHFIFVSHYIFTTHTSCLGPNLLIRDPRHNHDTLKIIATHSIHKFANPYAYSLLTLYTSATNC